MKKASYIEYVYMEKEHALIEDSANISLGALHTGEETLVSAGCELLLNLHWTSKMTSCKLLIYFYPYLLGFYFLDMLQISSSSKVVYF